MIKLESYGDIGKFLIARGWTIVPSQLSLGTAQCDQVRKTIWMLPRAFNNPNVRVRQYVVLHEMIHALHAEITNYEITKLKAVRKLTFNGALEVVADGGCLVFNKSRVMALWVKASVLWHGRVGYKYSLNDLKSPEAQEMINYLFNYVKDWKLQQNAATPQQRSSVASPATP